MKDFPVETQNSKFYLPGDNTAMKIKNYRKIYFLIVLFVCLWSTLFLVGSKFPINSDGVISLIEAKDLADGNVFMHGWYYSTGTYYFTDVVIESIFIKILGLKLFTYYTVSSFFLTLLIFLGIKISNIKATYSLFSLIPFIFMSSMGFSISLMPCIHISMYCFTLIILVILNKKNNDTYLYNSIVTTLVSICCASDPLFTYTTIVPLFLSYLLLITREPKKSYLSKLFCIVLGTILGIFLKKLMMHVGKFEMNGIIVPKMATEDEFFKNLNLFFIGMLDFFGADLFGSSLSPHKILPIITRLAFLSAIIVNFIYVAKRKLSQSSAVDLFIVISIIITILSYIVGNAAVDLASTRYLVFPFFLIGIYLSRNFKFEKFRFLWSAAAILYVLLSLPKVANNYIKTNKDHMAINNFLLSNGLSHGYATYWNAASNRVYGNVVIAPLAYNGTKYVPYRYLSKKEWYLSDGNFFICENTAELLQVESQFGLPDSEKNINGYYVLVWNHQLVV